MFRVLIKIICLAIISLSILISCSPMANANSYDNLFQEICEKANQERERILKTPVDFNRSKFECSYKDELDMFTEDEIKKIVTETEAKDVTKEAALEDVEYLFKILKNAYAGYIYFGGDEVFNAIKKDIINDVKGLNTNIVTSEVFGDIIINRLRPAITDGHFGMNGKSLNYKNVTYLSDDYDVNYKNNCYYLKIKSKEYQILSVDGDKNLSDYIKPTIKDDGSIGYGLFRLLPNNTDKEIKGVIRVKKLYNAENVNVNWRRATFLRHDKDTEVYQKSIVNNTNVYTIATMVGTQEMFKKFSDSALEAKECKAFILDIRGNTGGNAAGAYEWFWNYTGQDVGFNDVYITKDTPLTTASLIEAFRDYEEFELYSQMLLESADTSGEYQIYTYDVNWVDNDNYVIVLTDNYVASSGEIFASCLRTMDNVIFVGTDTLGARLGGSTSTKYLPYSGIDLYFGKDLSIDPGMVECTGYLPDIWVDSCDALDLAIKMIEYYGLNK